MTLLDRTAINALTGHRVTSSHGGKLGKVVDVYTSDDASGTFVTVSTGMFGGDDTFVPLAEATMDGDTLVVPYNKELVRDAPRVGAGGELTVDEEDRLYRHYQVAAPVEPVVSTEPVVHAQPVTDDAMTRSEQRLLTGTQRRESGRARLRKHVVTETVSRTVPVSHDEVVITREAISPGNSTAAVAGQELSNAVHEVVLTEEVAVSAKQTVPVERVRMSTHEVTEQAMVTEQLGHEVIEVEESS